MGNAAATAWLSRERPGRVHIRWLNEGLDYLGPRAADSLIATVTQKLGAGTRQLFTCGLCERALAALILREGQWGCRHCQGLRHLSALSRRSDYGRRQVGPAIWKRSTAARVSSEAGDTQVTRDQFPYWEAFPRLDATTARHALRQGQRLCLWSDQRSVIGGADLDRESDDTLRVRYALQRTLHHYGSSGSMTLHIARRGSLNDNRRWLFACPLCGSARQGIALVGPVWGCRGCHDLSYRSAMVGTTVRLSEIVLSLRAQLESARAIGRRGSRAKRHEMRLKAALTKLGGEELRSASPAYAYRVVDRWVAGEFDEEGFYDLLPYRRAIA
jgi:ribosomal protein L37AE/L43A